MVHSSNPKKVFILVEDYREEDTRYTLEPAENYGLKYSYLPVNYAIRSYYGMNVEGLNE